LKFYQKEELLLRRSTSKFFRIAVGFNPNPDESGYFPARIPWFFSGKINR